MMMAEADRNVTREVVSDEDGAYSEVLESEDSECDEMQERQEACDKTHKRTIEDEKKKK